MHTTMIALLSPPCSWTRRAWPTLLAALLATLLAVPSYAQPVTGARQTYSIALHEGVNLVALPVVPEDRALSTVTADILPDLMLIQDDHGRHLIPSVELDEIEAWRWDATYKIRATSPTTLVVAGATIAPELSPIILEGGAHWVPYLRNAPLPVEQAFASILKNLRRVEDEAGRAYEPGQPNPTLDSLHVGRGYRLWLTRRDTLRYPVNEARFGPWEWLPHKSMVCRDGSSTGFGLRRKEGSSQLLIYLQGGGACFNPVTCEGNPASHTFSDFTEVIADHDAKPGGAGFLNFTEPDNPFLDYNVAFVPYCTGDIHGGDTTSVVPGVERPQLFRGRANIQAVVDSLLALERAEAWALDTVVYAGMSAGGFGALATYEIPAQAWPDLHITMIDDAGPLPADDDVLTPGLQQLWRELWNVKNPKPCGPECQAANGDGLEHFLPALAREYPDAAFGVISYEYDPNIGKQFAFYDCPYICATPAGAYRDALFDWRTILPDNVGTFYIPGSGHTSTFNGKLFENTVEGIKQTDWIRNLLDGRVTNLPRTPY